MFGLDISDGSGKALMPSRSNHVSTWSAHLFSALVLVSSFLAIWLQELANPTHGFAPDCPHPNLAFHTLYFLTV